MRVSLALVHHANQYLITDGYEHREGITDIVGSENGTGILAVLALHQAEAVPLNLHISGTLLEAIAWHCPSAVDKIRKYLESGLVELVGSSYGQNIMRFFSADYNHQQLNEELRLYKSLLGVRPEQVKVFWPPERVWDTKPMAPVLRDANLLNEGYRYVILDDRTLLSPRDSSLPRSVYDQGGQWTSDTYQSHEIENGLGLIALPIAVRLRRSIPPKRDADWRCVQEELDALLVDSGNNGNRNLLALYADDLEKVIGVWGPDGPLRYAAFLQWIKRNKWLKPVTLSDWASNHPPADCRKIDIGTFEELAHEFNAGEGYEKWYYSRHWAPYRDYFQQTEERVKQCKASSADPALIELAEKQLLVSNWETAWHTPATGPHGDPVHNGEPSPWARSLTSHCRHALVTAEAATWMMDRDGRAHAACSDIDLDGEPDLVLKNDAFYALVSSRWGGRVVSMFYFGTEGGAMVVGNPCDDWNFLEDLNRYMEAPRNHPGAFADIGFENDQYTCEVLSQGERAAVRLVNIEKDSAALGLQKEYEFGAADSGMTIRYRLPATLSKLSIECALSPDYLSLLRNGIKIVQPMDSSRSRGFAANNVKVLLEIGPQLRWETPRQERIGHGWTLQIGARNKVFELKLHAEAWNQKREAA